MTNKEIKLQFKDYLPKGYVRRIQAELAKKGIIKSVGFISQVCNPEKKQFDNDIIRTALKIAKDEKAKLEATQKLAENL